MSSIVVQRFRDLVTMNAGGFISWSKGGLLESQGRDSTHSTFQKYVTKLTDSKIKCGWKDIII